jgi:hypothetical protein
LRKTKSFTGYRGAMGVKILDGEIRDGRHHIDDPTE